MRRALVLITAAAALCAAPSPRADDGPVVGVVEWEPNIPYENKTDYDKTDFWCAIAFSPSTGKYGASCYWTARENADRAAREACNAPDARVVVLCCNGWCSLAMGAAPDASGRWGWGVGWAPGQERAEQFALDGARGNASGAKVVYSIFARQMRFNGVIAYSTATGNWGYSCAYGRSDAARAVQFSGDPNAQVIVGKNYCGWMALATGDDKSAWGWGGAGNRLDAERTALKECGARTKNPKIAVSFCTNGVAH